MSAAVRINLRATRASQVLIDQAADISGRNRSEFMLEAACEKAREVLLDRTQFELGAAAHGRFARALEGPLPDAAAIARLLSRRAPWEGDGR